jgi:hypothetical protein
MTQIRKWGVRSPLGTAVGCGKMSAAGKRFAIPSVSAAARASWRLRRHNSQGRATGEPSPPATRPRRCRNPPSRHTRTHTHKPSPPIPRRARARGHSSYSPPRPRSPPSSLFLPYRRKFFRDCIVSHLAVCSSLRRRSLAPHAMFALSAAH